MARGDYEPLVGSAGAAFEYANRPYRDRIWALAYLLLVGVSVVGGVYGAMHSNPLYKHAVRPEYMDDPSHCPLHRGGRRLLQEGGEFDLGQFFRLACRWLLVSAALALLLGVAFLQLFRHHADKAVKGTAAMMVTLPLAAAAAVLLGIGHAGGGAHARPGLLAASPFLLMAGLAAVTFYMWRDFLPLAGRLLSVAAEGLNANARLIPLVFAGQLALLAFSLPLAALLFVAWTNGDVVPNPERGGSTSCKDSAGEAITCCVWQPDAWVPPYLAAGALALGWTTFLAFTMRLYVISGVTAQWYFAAPGEDGRVSTRGNVRRSLRHALTTSFGSLSFGSAVLWLLEALRSAADSGRQSEGEGLAGACLRALASCLAQLLEYLTKFAVVRAAITGEAFLTAGSQAAALLRRNFLKSVGVWWLPPMVLNMASLVIAVVWGGAVFGTSYWAWHGQSQGVADAAVLTALSTLLVALVLGFFSSVLLDCVDACYLCYAMDRDVGSQTRPEVHDVFARIPNLQKGPAVQNPDGSFMYGAPAAAAAAAGQQPFYAPPQQQHYYPAPPHV